MIDKLNEEGTAIEALLRKMQEGNETAFDVIKYLDPDGSPHTSLSLVSRRVNAEPPTLAPCCHSHRRPKRSRRSTRRPEK
jgi:hypothetical protein